MMMWKRMIISFPYITLFKAEHLKGELCDDILLHLIAKKIEKIMTKTCCTIKDISLHEHMIKDITVYLIQSDDGNICNINDTVSDEYVMKYITSLR